MTDIDRHGTSARMSDAVVHNGVAYLKGHVPRPSAGEDVESQTRDVLAQIVEVLQAIGSGKDLILSASIWLSDIGTIDAFNSLWDEWLPDGAAPARACVEARLASPRFKVEVGVTAAVAARV